VNSINFSNNTSTSIDKALKSQIVMSLMFLGYYRSDYKIECLL